MDEPLKQRLVGALVVGTFAVVVVPWLLGEPQAPPAKRQPAPPDPPAVTSAPANVKPALVPPPLPPPNVEHSAPTQRSPAAPTAPRPQVNEGTESSTANAPTAPADSSAAGIGGWQVQAATLSSEDSATRLVTRLRSASLDARAEQSGRFWRVYVVGFESREDADGARARLQLEFSLSGVIQKVTP